jgi:heat shock protein HtpX
MAAYGLYTHIQSNKRRSIALLIGLFILVYVMVFAGALLAEALSTYSSYNAPPLDYLVQAAVFDFVKAFPYATIGTLVWIVIAYKFHQSLIDAVTGAQPVARRDEPRLYNLLENLCISRGITTPTLRIADDDALNAFATGLNEKQYSITVTRGLINALDDKEIEAVLGHELTHIRNGDVRMLVIAVVIAGAISFFGELVFRIFFQNVMWGGGRRSSSDERKSGASLAIIIAIAIIAVVWILSVVIRFALSRQREFLADAGSVELTKDPDAMISALRKIEGRSEIPGANSAVMEMCCDNPREGFSNIFDTHPSVEARVEALVKFAGGHDPGPLAIAGPVQNDDASNATPAGGPWGGGTQDEDREKPFLPDAPPVGSGPWGPEPGAPMGPWGPKPR